MVKRRKEVTLKTMLRLHVTGVQNIIRKLQVHYILHVYKTRKITNFDFGNTVRLKALCESTTKDHTNNYVVQKLKS